VADYVLHDFSTEEQEDLRQLISHVTKACEALTEETLTQVKSLYSLKSIEGLKA